MYIHTDEDIFEALLGGCQSSSKYENTTAMYCYTFLASTNARPSSEIKYLLQ